MVHWVGLFFGALAFASDVQFKLVTELHREESHEAQLFHGGHLWEGDFAKGQVRLYASDGTLLDSAQVPHIPDQIYPFSDGVLVVGSYSWPWESRYTLLRSKNNRIGDQQTYSIPEETLVQFFAGGPNGLFFTALGENRLARVKQVGDAPDKLSVKIQNPGQLLLIGDQLYAIERLGIGSATSNLVKVHTTLGNAKRLFKDGHRGTLTHLAPLQNGRMIALTEGSKDNVLLVETATDAVVSETGVPGYPIAAAELGHCLVVLSATSRQITFLDVSNANAMVAQWDLSPAGDRLGLPRTLSIDPSSGRLYVRSAYPCPTCSVTQSSVFMFEQPSQDTFRACVL